jgi:hypothetical protein
VINQNKELLDKCTQAKEARKLNCCITSVCKLLSSGKRSITTIFALGKTMNDAKAVKPMKKTKRKSPPKEYLPISLKNFSHVLVTAL